MLHFVLHPPSLSCQVHSLSESTKSGAWSMRGAEKWSLLLWWFYTLLPSSNWIFLQHALRLTYIHPSHTHTNPPPHDIHNHMQMLMHGTLTIALYIKPRGCVKSIYPDDYVLLLVVHPAIEPFTTRNSVPSVERCGVCKLPRLVPELLSPSTSSMHNMMTLLLVLSVITIHQKYA